MSDWLSIVAVVTGAIGAITGIAGLVLGYKGYRKAQNVKALDLRLELRKAVTDARAIIGRLPKLMVNANVSRRAALSARGFGDSSLMRDWTMSWDADRKEVVSLREEFSRLDHDYTALTDHAQLESCLVSVYILTRRAAEIQTKYEGTIVNDEKTLDRLASDRGTRLDVGR